MEQQQPSPTTEPIIKPEPISENQPDIETNPNLNFIFDIESMPNYKSELNIKSEYSRELEPDIKLELYIKSEPCMTEPIAMEQYSNAKIKSTTRSEALGIHIYTSDAGDSAMEDNDLKELTSDTDNSTQLYTDESRRESTETEATSGSDSYVHPSRRQNFEIETTSESSTIDNFKIQLASYEPKRRRFMTGANSKPLGYIDLEDRPVQHNLSSSLLTTANRVIFSSNRAIASGGKLRFVLDKSEIKQLRMKFKTARIEIAKLDAPYGHFRQTLNEIGNGVGHMTPIGAQDTGGLAIFKSRYSALENNLGQVIAYLERTSEYFDQELEVLRADLVGAQPVNEKVLQQTMGRGGKRKSDEMDYGMGS